MVWTIERFATGHTTLQVSSTKAFTSKGNRTKDICSSFLAIKRITVWTKSSVHRTTTRSKSSRVWTTSWIRTSSKTLSVVLELLQAGTNWSFPLSISLYRVENTNPWRSTLRGPVLTRRQTREPLLTNWSSRVQRTSFPNSCISLCSHRVLYNSNERYLGGIVDESVRVAR